MTVENPDMRLDELGNDDVPVPIKAPLDVGRVATAWSEIATLKRHIGILSGTEAERKDIQ